MRALARFLALAAALLVVLPAGALPAQYYCRWMGQTMTSCCCRGHETKAKPKKARRPAATDVDEEPKPREEPTEGSDAEADEAARPAADD